MFVVVGCVAGPLGPPPPRANGYPVPVNDDTVAAPRPPVDEADPAATEAREATVSALMRILEARWVFALSTLEPGHPAPYPTPLFYALEARSTGAKDAPALLFASSPRSHHSTLIPEGAELAAAGAVYLESENVGELRGAQLRGRLTRVAADALTEARAAYLARHPVAAPALEKGHHALYRFEIEWAKLTDNRLGFGRHPEVRFPDGSL